LDKVNSSCVEKEEDPFINIGSLDNRGSVNTARGSLRPNDIMTPGFHTCASRSLTRGEDSNCSDMPRFSINNIPSAIPQISISPSDFRDIQRKTSLDFLSKIPDPIQEKQEVSTINEETKEGSKKLYEGLLKSVRTASVKRPMREINVTEKTVVD
jgi:hypothetical protein